MVQSGLLVVAVVAVALGVVGVAAVCPTNGNTHAIYATVNGESINTILMLNTDGRLLGSAINHTSVPKHVALYKMRAMVKGPDDKIYVAVAEGEYSRIIVLSHTVNRDCTRDYITTFVARKDSPQLRHPYGIAFAPNGDMLVSNQNSVTVTRYLGPVSKTPGKAHDPPPFLLKAEPHKEHQVGVWIPQNHPQVKLTSVRGIAVSPDGKYLLVADTQNNTIVVFHEATATLAWTKPIMSPVQFMFVGKSRVYITTKEPGLVYMMTLEKDAHIERFADLLPTESSSGLIRNADGLLTVADRRSRRLYRLRDDGVVLGVTAKLPDHPEHLLGVMLVDPTKLPMCHELAEVGTKFSVLCAGGIAWLGVVVVFVAAYVFTVFRRLVKRRLFAPLPTTSPTKQSPTKQFGKPRIVV